MNVTLSVQPPHNFSFYVKILTGPEQCANHKILNDRHLFRALNEVRSLSLVDSSGRNIKYSYIGTIYATAGSVCHDEIVFRLGVPCPKCITAFHQIIKDKSLSWSDRVGAIAAYNLWYGLTKINRERKCRLC